MNLNAFDYDGVLQAGRFTLNAWPIEDDHAIQDQVIYMYMYTCIHVYMYMYNTFYMYHMCVYMYSFVAIIVIYMYMYLFLFFILFLVKLHWIYSTQCSPFQVYPVDDRDTSFCWSRDSPYNVPFGW